MIGHEISHHFDDQGAKYDENGRLADWWTPEDVKPRSRPPASSLARNTTPTRSSRAASRARSRWARISAISAGLTVAYDAYKHSLGGAEAPVLDGTTGDQRFYLGWAQVWRRNYREANLRQRLITDPHSPSEQRTWVVRNLDPGTPPSTCRPARSCTLRRNTRARIW